MADSLTPLLLDAKKEYTKRLAEILTPFLLKYIDTTYAAALEEAGGAKSLVAFQQRLRTVPGWNAGIIREYTAALENKYSYFSDLVAAVFVTMVKVLSSIKLSANRPNVKLKLPTNDAFVHKVYVCTARNFYECPQAARDNSPSQRSHLVAAALETAVRDLLPLGDVLHAYLSSAVNEDKTVNPILSPVHSDDEHSITSSESDFGGDDEDSQPKIVTFPSHHQTPETHDPFTPPAEPAPPTFPEAPHQTAPAPAFTPYPAPAAAAAAPPLATPTATPPAPATPTLFPDAEDDRHHFG